MPRLGSFVFIGALAAALFAVSAGPGQAQDAPVSFKGKTIYMSMGEDAGSGGDLYNRLLARFIGNHIPGNPKIVPQNMPGAGGMTHLNYMYNIAPKDGTAIGLTHEDTPYEPLYMGKASLAKFDARKFNWLGAPNQFPSVSEAWYTAPVKTAQDLFTHELLIGGIGLVGGANDAYVLDNVLGFKYRVILGYPGPTAVDLAMERGELQGRAGAGWEGLNARHADWIAQKKVNILYQEAITKNPLIPDSIPLLLDFAKTPADRELLELRYGPNSLGFPYMLPPGTPPAVVATIRQAFEETLKDPALLAAAQTAKLDIVPVTYQTIDSILKGAYETPQAVRDRLVAASKPPPGLDATTLQK